MRFRATTSVLAPPSALTLSMPRLVNTKRRSPSGDQLIGAPDDSTLMALPSLPRRHSTCGTESPGPSARYATALPSLLMRGISCTPALRVSCVACCSAAVAGGRLSNTYAAIAVTLTALRATANRVPLPELAATLAVVRAVSAGVIPPLDVAHGSSAACNSAAVWKRSPACFARQRKMIAARAGAMPARCTEGASGARVTCAASTCCGDPPTNGGRPVSSSYAIAPTA